MRSGTSVVGILVCVLLCGVSARVFSANAVQEFGTDALRPTVIPDTEGDNVISFRSVGYLMAGVTFAHVEVEVDVRAITQSVRDFVSDSRGTASRMNDSALFPIVTSRLDELGSECYEVEFMVGSAASRQQRAVFLTAVVSTLVSGVTSMLFWIFPSICNNYPVWSILKYNNRNLQNFLNFQPVK